MRPSLAKLLVVLLAATVVGASCGSSTDDSSAEGASSDAAPAGIRLVAPEDGAAILENPPEDLVVLDVRTPEEFADGHLDDATMIDFYRSDFQAELAKLDPDVPYLLYCRSGNRSGQTSALMKELGFADVAEIDGGILAWQSGGYQTVDE